MDEVFGLRLDLVDRGISAFRQAAGFLAALVVLLLTPAAAEACTDEGGRPYLPPGSSVLDETCDTIPGPDGARTAKDPLGVGRGIPSSVQARLERAGPDGKGVLVLTRTEQARGPVGGDPAPGPARPPPAGPAAGAAPSGEPFAVLGAVVAAGGPGGLLLALAALAVVIAGIVVSRRRERSEGPRLPWYVVFGVSAVAVFVEGLLGASYDVVVREREALVTWWLVAVALAWGVGNRRRLTVEGGVTLLAFALLAVWTAVSLGWTASDERTLAEVARVAHYTGVVTLVWLVVPRRGVPAAIGGLAAGAIGICAVAMAIRVGAFSAGDLVERVKNNRIAEPLNYWNSLSAWAAIAAAMAVALSAHPRHLVARAAWAATIPLCWAVVYLTYSRGGVAAAIVAALLAVLFSRNRLSAAVHGLGAAAATGIVIGVIRGQPQIADATGHSGAGAVVAALIGAGLLSAAVAGATTRSSGRALPSGARRLLAPGLAVALLALAGGAVAARGEVTKAWDDLRSANGPVETADPASRLRGLGSTRPGYWRIAIDDGARPHPWRGTGAGTFEFTWSRSGAAAFLRDAHSLYVEPASELGIPGFLLTVLALVALLVTAALSRLRATGPVEAGAQAAGLAAFLAFAVQAGLEPLWEQTALAVLALAAVAAAGVRAATTRGAGLPAVRPVLAVAVVIACAVQLPGLASTSALRASQAAWRAHDANAALDHAGDAIAATPWGTSGYAQRALVEESAGRFAAARTDLQRAAARDPKDWRFPMLLARIDAESVGARAALADYRRARRLRPGSVFFPLRPARTSP